MNIKQIQYVLTLANAGSFAKASDVLNISQPSLSQYIKKIENQLGVELFDRSGSVVRLTDAGRIYVDAGRKVLDLEHQMRGQLEDLSVYKNGTIVVGTSPYRSASMMPTIAKRFSEVYPGMHLVIDEMTSQELVDATEHGQFDLCLTMLPVNELLFDYEKIAEEELILAVPKGYELFSTYAVPGRKYPAIDASVLDKQAFVMIQEGQYMQHALDHLVADYDLSLRKVAVVKSLEAQISMVRAGLGMALLPSGIEHCCGKDEVQFYSFVQNLPRREVVVLWQRNRKLNTAMKELVRIMKEISW